MDQNTSAGAYSNLKAFYHHDRIMLLEEGKRNYPVYVRLKPTNICNHNCYYCSYADGNSVNRNSVNSKDYIPWQKMQEIVQDMGRMDVKAVTFSGGGEPLIYNHILDAVKLLKDFDINISLITNGQLLKGKTAEAFYDASWVRISLDSPDAETYSTLRGINKDLHGQVCINIQNFAHRKSKDCNFGINYVIGDLNYHQVFEMGRLCKLWGVNNIKFSAIAKSNGYSKTKHDYKKIVQNQIHKIKTELQDDKFIVIDNYSNETAKEGLQKDYRYCYIKELVTVIAADCKVYYCHQRAYERNAVVADINRMSFKDAWDSPETAMRMQNLTPCRDCLNPCAYEERNVLLNNYFNIDKNQVNFI